MVVHKRIAQAIKKRLPKKGKVEHDLPAIPQKYGFPPLGLGLLAARGNPAAVALLTYIAMEQTQPYWGPPVEAHGERTREQYDAFMDEYFGSRGQVGPPAVLSPKWPRFAPEHETPDTPTKPKRKISKANKATKLAYAYLVKLDKGKMTRKKCRALLKKAAKMASKANPNTKSRIGKRITKMLKECGKIRRNIWGTNKRY